MTKLIHLVKRKKKTFSVLSSQLKVANHFLSSVLEMVRLSAALA